MLGCKLVSLIVFYDFDFVIYIDYVLVICLILMIYVFLG